MGDNMESISNFLNLLIRGDFFLIFLLIMMVIIIGVIIYLVKLQITDNKSSLNEDDIDDFDYQEILRKKESELKEKEVIKESPPIKEPEINKIEDVLPNTLKEETRKITQEKFDFDAKPEEKEEINEEINDIENYEKEQEELAIISASELENRLKDMKNRGEYTTSHKEEIEKYEREQENKAIISYEELLRRASNNNVSYEKVENIGGIHISKVDTDKIEEHIETNDLPYYKEEAFLEALKEFRRAL